jgi:hypothetical protein
VDVEPTGDLIDIEYKRTDRITVYDALRELCAGGLEFEIALDWADNTQTSVVKILRIRRRIGRVSGTPRAMFETGGSGSVISYDLKESWADGYYGNHTTAIGPGEGDDQPASAPAIDMAALLTGTPIVESVIEAGNNVNDIELLDVLAQSDLLRTRFGGSSLEIQAQLDAYPRLGVDALLGDQVSFHLVGPRHPRHRPLIGERRMTGWRMSTAQGVWVPKLVADPGLHNGSELFGEE